MLDRIASRDNEKIKRTCKIAGSAALRAQESLFFAEGKKLCLDLAQTLRVHTAFFTEKCLRETPEVAGLAAEGYLVSEPVSDKLSTTKAPQGLYCLFEMPPCTLQALQPQNGILLCENLQDPANVGAVLRSAAAFGFGGVMLLGACADPFSPKALRAAMGAVGRIPLVANEDVSSAADFIRAAGGTLYASALANAKPLSQIQPSKPFGLLIGSEGAGLTQQALAVADHTVYIPMHNGVESLNVAVAASVLMHHFSQ